MDKRCFWGLSIFLIQNRSTIFVFAFLYRKLIFYRFLDFLGINYHQFVYRQKVKTDEVYQPQLFHWLDEKGDSCFSRQWKFFQHDFHHNDLNKNT